jgi:hypothetical protein
MGDLVDDCAYKVDDANTALMISVRLVHALDWQWVAGDMNGDLIVDSVDAAMILRLVAGLNLFPAGPVLHPAGQMVLSAANVAGDPGSFVEVPISINDPTGLAATDITVNYGPGVTLESAAAVALGSLTADFITQARLAEGTAQIGLVRATGLSSDAGPGSIVKLTFRISPSAAPGSVVPIQIATATLKGEFGQDFEWYGSLEKKDGAISVNGKSQSGCCCFGDGSGKSSDAPLRNAGGDMAIMAVAGLALLASRSRKP